MKYIYMYYNMNLLQYFLIRMIRFSDINYNICKFMGNNGDDLKMSDFRG